jgi:hypothetical protein
MSQKDENHKTVQEVIDNPIDFFLKLKVFSEYTKCVVLLLEGTHKEPDDIKNLAYPIIYNFKHALELGLKLFETIHKGYTSHGHNILDIDGRIKKNFVDKYNLSHDDNVFFSLSEEQNKSIIKYINAVKKIDVPEDLRKILLDTLQEADKIDYKLIKDLVNKYHRKDDIHNTRYRYANPNVFFGEKKRILEDIKNDIKYLLRLDYICTSILYEGLAGLVNLNKYDKPFNKI